MEIALLNYCDVRHKIRDGDLVFWSPTNLPGRVIAAGTGGRFSHVGSVSRAGDVLETHEMLQFYGGRTVYLSHYVRRYPGKIHVYRVPGLEDEVGYAFSQLQRRRSGEPYCWPDLLSQAFRCVGGDTLRPRLLEIDRMKEPALWERMYRTPAGKSAFCSESVLSDLRLTVLKLGEIKTRLLQESMVSLDTLAAWEVAPTPLATVAEYQFTLDWRE
jgi:hypothetical protein